MLWKSNRAAFLFTIDFKGVSEILVKRLELDFEGNKRSSEKLSLDLEFNATANCFSIW